ncbi:hypothetical protein O6H91_13G048000 [Diphasiastrum complanatum]|uniref:Uncharacterized protein n=1 Tax=Diphasiastrum complanatum TaxID=34168 RepID=A0ACC2BUJ0_DIPCM|nr:hypothetical protein O6H91_13G048000 [Diphasiastrum complanatum]
MMPMASRKSVLLLLLLLLELGLAVVPAICAVHRVCIVGSGIAGASTAFFLRNYSDSNLPLDIHIFEQRDVVGGRMAMVDLAGDKFEAGASILHPKNLYTVGFTDLLGLKRVTESDSSAFGFWDGEKFVFRTLQPGCSVFSKKITDLLNTLAVVWRYGLSLFQMRSHVQRLLERFTQLYAANRKAYSTVEDLLRSVELYDATQHTLADELIAEGLSAQIINELVTVITRINYGQNATLSGLAGSVALCGSGADLWAVAGGNWRMADGLIKYANASLYLNEKVVSISSAKNLYNLSLASGEVENCDAVVIATPLDEEKISFDPPIHLPDRHMQHTFVTFVRGLANSYFNLESISSMPDLIGTLETSAVPFTSISVLKSYNDSDKAYKVFSRNAVSDDLLDLLFSRRDSTIRLDWAAYPHFKAPEHFASFILDGQHLYYINAFENAASTIETSALAAENVVRLLLERLSHGSLKTKVSIPVVSSDRKLYKDL